MNKKETQELTNDMLITDALLQLKTLQDLLIAKGVFTKEEFLETMEEIAKKVASQYFRSLVLRVTLMN
jgi:hypothetical protein